MRRMWSLAVMVMFAAAVSVGAGATTDAQEKPKKEPVRFSVVQSFEPGPAGIAKAQLINFEMDPGAEIKGFKVGSAEILWVTKGAFTYKYGDKVVERKTGHSWQHQEGVTIDVSNKGKAVAVLRGIQFLTKK